MPIAYTSELAYRALQDDLSGLRLEVWSAIRAWDPVVRGPGPSIEDLAEVLGRKESSICGRLAELADLGLILDGPLKANSTGHQAKTYLARVWREPAPMPAIDHTGQALLFAPPSAPRSRAYAHA